MSKGKPIIVSGKLVRHFETSASGVETDYAIGNMEQGKIVLSPPTPEELAELGVNSEVLIKATIGSFLSDGRIMFDAFNTKENIIVILPKKDQPRLEGGIICSKCESYQPVRHNYCANCGRNLYGVKLELGKDIREKIEQPKEMSKASCLIGKAVPREQIEIWKILVELTECIKDLQERVGKKEGKK